MDKKDTMTVKEKINKNLSNLISEINRLKEREKLWMEYCDLLADELSGQAAFTWVHGIRPLTSRVQRSQNLRDQLGIKEHPILPDAKPLTEIVEEEIISRSSNPDFLPDKYYILRMSGKSKEEIQYKDIHTRSDIHINGDEDD